MYQSLLNSFSKYVGYASHQIESFDDFVEKGLNKIVNEIGEVELETPENAEFKIKLGGIRIPKPSIKEADGATREITPSEARIRDLTYAAPLLVEMIPIINGIEQDPQEVKLGELPIMVKSGRCNLHGMSREELEEAGEDPDDPGGYFIINGTERVIVMVEEVLSNRPVIEIKGDLEVARINSESNGFVQRHVLERKNGIMTISFANLKKLPVVVLLRALGADTDKDLIENITDKKSEMQELYFNLFEFGVNTQEEAKEFIGNKLRIPQKEYRDKRVNDILDKYLLPHIGQKRSARDDKIIYLSKVVRKLLKLGLNKIEEQDIDHYANKRLSLVGDFLEILFRSILLGKYGLVSRIVYSYQKLVKRGKMPSLNSIVESEYLTKRIISHMATGQWVGGRTGVCQRLERTNYIRAVAHLRNVISPLSSAQEHFEARALHCTHWGRLCCEETPEGINIGLRKYLATMAIISREADPKEIKEILKLIEKEDSGNYTIFLDGNVAGTTNKPEPFSKRFKELRIKRKINHHINIAIIEELAEVHVNTDSGRLQRPLIAVNNGKSALTKEMITKLDKDEITWHDLVKQGVIEYLDAEEEENSFIATDADSIMKDATHLEIHPAIILGLSASLVPFPTHNRGDRVNFGAKMSGQSLGLYATNFLTRADTKSDVLIYTQKPLVNTMIGNFMKLDDHSQGQNITIAIMSFSGYNMEDGIVFNKASIERGVGRSVFFRAYVNEEKKYWGIEKDEIKIPDTSVSGYRGEEAYANLASDGIINREMEVESGDVLVGKISPLRFFGPTENFMMETENRRETSETIRHGEKGVVENVFLSESSSGNKLVKIIVRSDRPAEVGDKFASRHGQKGVVALIVPEEDMPFTEDGIIPDIIINPHAIPSRMTIGQLLEILAAKMSALGAVEIDSSAFNKEVTEENIRGMIKQLGFRDDGKESMCNGVTGKNLEARIMIGPCYYQKLHHMVANKMHSRARGPVTLLTKQPTAGRAKQGGLRLGEMEKDCLVAHGAALLLKERFDSDKSKIAVCQNCGLFALEDFAKGKRACPLCKKSKINDVEMSYAFKLMLDELRCMGIYPKIKTGER